MDENLPPPYDPRDKQCFAYETVVKRWPVIIVNVIDCVYQVNHALSTNPNPETPSTTINEKITEGKAIIEAASKLKYNMARDHLLEPIPEDNGPHVELFNQELEKLTADSRGTWFTAPWLYAECYLYRLMRTWFARTTHWQDFDPFFAQKEETFKSSGAAVYQLAKTMAELDVEAQTSGLEQDLGRLEILFDEMIQMCFWGNATDLSLLPTMSSADIERLQSVGKEAQSASRQYILRDDIDVAWKYVSSLKNARLDIVLDNSGFEFFTDLILADFLVSHTPFIGRVVFHPKQIPWFVSDVTPPDVRELLSALTSLSQTDASASSYFSTQPPSQEHVDALAKMSNRWKRYFADGTFEVNGYPGMSGGLAGGSESKDQSANGTEFWTRPGGYRELVGYPGLAGLEGSGLVIFKGDLNYRKLTSDLRWPTSTPIEVVLGPLAGKFPILSLRTSKADVVVGLKPGLGEQMDGDPDKKGWRVNGRYGMITFVPQARCSNDDNERKGNRR